MWFTRESSLKSQRSNINLDSAKKYQPWFTGEYMRLKQYVEIITKIPQNNFYLLKYYYKITLNYAVNLMDGMIFILYIIITADGQILKKV